MNVPAAARLALYATISAGLAAMMFRSNGYPTEDAPIANPFELSQPQVIDGMNALGRKAHADLRWDYRQASACEVQVTRSGKQARPHSFTLPLADADVSLSFDEQGQTYDVQLASRADPSSGDANALIESQLRIDAMAMRLLVLAAQIHCAAASDGAPDA